MASRNVRIVVQALDQFLDNAIKKIALDVVAELVKAPSEGGTPVDTGWARANWIPRIGQAGTTTSKRPRKGERASTAEQTAAVAEVAATYTAKKGPIVITNNVPYIVFLNFGSSPQAPSGFVQAAIARAANNFVRSV